MNTPALRSVQTLFVSLCLAQAVAQADDIVSIKSDQANYVYTSSGSDVDFKITLAGTFVLTNTYYGTMALLPELRMIVNGSIGFAALHSLSQYRIGGLIDRTDVIFRYRIKPGDLAQPLRIYGSPDVAYQFYWNGWEIRNATTQSNAVWRFAPWNAIPSEGEVYDLDLARANITLRTLSFDDLHSPSSIQATVPETWRVATGNPAEGAAVDLYVWTPQTNIVRIGAAPGQQALPVSIPSGSSFQDVPIRGLSVGTAEIYLQRPGDYQNNATAGVTNYLKRTVTVTAPPPPAVRIIFPATGTDSVTLNETNSLNTGTFRVELSEAFTNAVSVRVDLAPSSQTSVTFATAPMTVTIAPNQTLSSEQAFSVPDGNATGLWGVTLTPEVINEPAASHYTDLKSATVFVQNVKPSVLAWAPPVVSKGIPCTFEWTVADVSADLSSDTRVQWNLNGEAFTNVFGPSGTFAHTFSAAGLKTITVTATDKDGLSSDPYVFHVEVKVPPPVPNVRVVPTATLFNEMTGSSSGSLVVYTSEAVSYDVWVRLDAALQSGQPQSNLVLSDTNAVRIAASTTNSAPVSFRCVDGTLDSEIFGIEIEPTVTNEPACGYFTDKRSAVIYVNNLAPVVTKPYARDPGLTPRPQYTNVPLGRSFAFDYVVTDAAPDLSGMAVRWNFGDGTSETVVTGAVGSVSHTYGSLGVKTVSVQATDKDGASSEIVFPICVVVPPPPPTVSVTASEMTLEEANTPNTGQVFVRLSEAFTNLVTVSLTVSPATNAVNGAIVLATNRVVFLIGQTEKTVRFSVRDGTAASVSGGFTITPSVVGNAAAAAYFTESESGMVTVMNVAPVIVSPLSSAIVGDPLFTVPQGKPWLFYWSVTDVPLDLSTMSCTWYFGDGTVQAVTGGAGAISHTYAVAGEMIVLLVARDKDGGQSQSLFKIRVVKADGFAEWAAARGLSGDPYVLFDLDRDGDGLANGFEYAFGANLAGVPLITLKFVDGGPVVETPMRDPDSTADAYVTVEACTNLASGQWTVPMGPCPHAAKPSDRDWYAPLTTVPKSTFFRLRAILD